MIQYCLRSLRNMRHLAQFGPILVTILKNFHSCHPPFLHPQMMTDAVAETGTAGTLITDRIAPGLQQPSQQLICLLFSGSASAFTMGRDHRHLSRLPATTLSNAVSF